LGSGSPAPGVRGLRGRKMEIYNTPKNTGSLPLAYFAFSLSFFNYALPKFFENHKLWSPQNNEKQSNGEVCI
jgi:hypothetical protein